MQEVGDAVDVTIVTLRDALHENHIENKETYSQSNFAHHQ